MSKIFVAILFIFLFSCSPDKQVRICTFNIRLDNPGDGVNSWETRMPLIQSFFQKEKLDIIGLQEVTHKQLIDLQKMLPDYNFVGQGREERKESGEYCPIFYKKSKFSILIKSQFWLSDTPDIPGSISWMGTIPRVVTWAKMKNNHSGHIFFVFNTHFCHLSETAREKSAILLLRKINEIAGYAPVLLTGDFNADKDSKTYQILTSNWDRFISMMDSESLAKKFFNRDSSTFNGFGSKSAPQKIDFVFVNSYFSVSNYKIHVIKDNGVYISDHYPVSITAHFLFERQARLGPTTEVPW